MNSSLPPPSPPTSVFSTKLGVDLNIDDTLWSRRAKGRLLHLRAVKSEMIVIEPVMYSVS